MADQSIARRVLFQAKCRTSMCDWTGPDRDRKWMAGFDLARHNVDHHGGAERIGSE